LSIIILLACGFERLSLVFFSKDDDKKVKSEKSSNVKILHTSFDLSDFKKSYFDFIKNIIVDKENFYNLIYSLLSFGTIIYR